MKKTNPRYFLALLLFSVHLWQATFVRPVADDYSLLKIYSQEGFTSFISFIWNNFGGNITPAVIRALYLSISLDASNWYGFIAFSITTSLLVIISYLIVITWLTNRGMRQVTINDLLIALLASLAFEGLFTPGLSSAYLFGAASGVHLWPICIFIISLKLIQSYSIKSSTFGFMGFLVLSIILGFIVGNSGIAESGAIFLALLMLVLNLYRRKSTQSHSRFRIATSVHLVGVGLGLATIFIAPGFSNRNNRLGKGNEDLFSLFESFRSSIVSFSGELITHPAWLFVFLIVVSGRFSFNVNPNRAKILLMYFFFTFAILVLGSTFGYAAWHQSSGLIFLLAPSAFCIPILSTRITNTLKRLGLVYTSISLIAMTLVLLGLVIRGIVVQENRSTTWDRNLLLNYCSNSSSFDSRLLGAEIKYWPIGLGIEDVNRWDWMEKDYRSWLSSLSQDVSLKCDASD